MERDRHVVLASIDRGLHFIERGFRVIVEVIKVRDHVVRQPELRVELSFEDGAVEASDDVVRNPLCIELPATIFRVDAEAVLLGCVKGLDGPQRQRIRDLGERPHSVDDAVVCLNDRFLGDVAEKMTLLVEKARMIAMMAIRDVERLVRERVLNGPARLTGFGDSPNPITDALELAETAKLAGEIVEWGQLLLGPLEGISNRGARERRIAIRPLTLSSKVFS